MVMQCHASTLLEHVTVSLTETFIEQTSEPALGYLQVPFAAIRYTTGECNYGGRVTDDKDRLLLITLLEKCCCQEVVSIPRHKLSPSGLYYAPEQGTHQDYLKYAFPIALS